MTTTDNHTTEGNGATGRRVFSYVGPDSGGHVDGVGHAADLVTFLRQGLTGDIDLQNKAAEGFRWLLFGLEATLHSALEELMKRGDGYGEGRDAGRKAAWRIWYNRGTEATLREAGMAEDRIAATMASRPCAPPVDFAQFAGVTEGYLVGFRDGYMEPNERSFDGGRAIANLILGLKEEPDAAAA
jgi:hypothetical protein